MKPIICSKCNIFSGDISAAETFVYVSEQSVATIGCTPTYLQFLTQGMMKGKCSCVSLAGNFYGYKYYLTTKGEYRTPPSIEVVEQTLDILIVTEPLGSYIIEFKTQDGIGRGVTRCQYKSSVPYLIKVEKLIELLRKLELEVEEAEVIEIYIEKEKGKKPLVIGRENINSLIDILGDSMSRIDSYEMNMGANK